MDKETKELREIARFYKDTKRGFATEDGYYAIPSKGKSLAIVHNGEILKFCRNEESARNFVDKLRKKKKALTMRISSARLASDETSCFQHKVSEG